MEGENNASPRPPSLESRCELRRRGTNIRSSSNPTLSMDVVPLEKVSENEGDNDNSFDHRDDHEQIAGFFSTNKIQKTGAGEPTMESTATAPATCEIARLPDDLLSALLARTGPLDVCRAAAVSRAFRAAADADTIWSSFLPRDLPPLADGELPAYPQPTKKQLFMRLSDSARPVLLADALTSMWLDRDTAAKCYMLSARKVCIMSAHLKQSCIMVGDTPQLWRWIPLTDSRFSEGAELLEVSWLDIHGKIHCNMLSQNTTYTACLVFKMSDESFGMELDEPHQVAEVRIGATKSTHEVCLGCGVQHPQTRRDGSMEDMGELKNELGEEGLHLQYPQTRADGWMEMELGELKNEDGDDGEVSIHLHDTWLNSWKKGLIVQGIEIRAKK